MKDDQSACEERIKTLKKERDELAAKLAKAETGEFNFCGYCGYQTESGDDGWRKLKLHINGCEKHPVYQLDVANTKLRNRLQKAEALIERAKAEIDCRKHGWKKAEKYFKDCSQIFSQDRAAKNPGYDSNTWNSLHPDIWHAALTYMHMCLGCFCEEAIEQKLKERT